MPFPWLIIGGAAAAAAGWVVLRERERLGALPPDDPADPRRWLAELERASESGDWGGALDARRRLAALARGEDRIHHLLAAARLCEDELGDADGAIACYEEVLLVNPDDAEAIEGLRFLRG